MLTERTLTFAINLGILECVHIPILNDGCVEETETFSVSITSEMDCVTVAPSASRVDITISDEDGELVLVPTYLLKLIIIIYTDVQVGFQEKHYTVVEGDTVEICVEHKDCLQRPVPVHVNEKIMGTGITV